MIDNLRDIQEFLVYITRISEFKDDVNYLPYLTAFTIKYKDSIKESLNAYFSEDFDIESNSTTWDTINHNFDKFINFVDKPINHLGINTGKQIYKSISEEWTELTKEIKNQDWALINSEFMMSFSVSGNIYVTRFEDVLLVLDFGFSD